MKNEQVGARPAKFHGMPKVAVALVPSPTLHSFQRLHSIDVGSFLTDLIFLSISVFFLFSFWFRAVD